MLSKIDNNRNTLTKIPTSTEFLIKYSPRECLFKFKEVKTIKQALSQNIGSLAQIKKGYGAELQREYVSLWIIDLQEKLGVKNKMHVDIITECAELILDEYYYFNLADVNLIFSRAKKGYYGQFYENISMPKILEWFENYSIERSEIAYQTNLSEHKAIKSDKATSKSIEYQKELSIAKNTKDFTKIDMMLKDRIKQTEHKINDSNDLRLKIEGLKDLISKIEKLKTECENPLLENQYQVQIDINEKQINALEKRLKELKS